jgi:O-succinylbenzoic acid--CoA ligase
VAGHQGRQLAVVPAAELTTADVQAALDGGRPLSVLPDGPTAVVEAALRALQPDEPLEDDAALVVVTSGSTGGGRAVLLSAEAVRSSAGATIDRLGGPGSWVLTLPVSAIAGLQVYCRSLLTGGAPVVLRPHEPLADAVSRLPEGTRRYTSLVPTQLRRFLTAEPDALLAFDAILVGGAATDPALLDQARDLGACVITTYGMTETAGGCVYDGRPLDGVGVRVTGDGIELSGPTLASGYRLDSMATAAAFTGGWFRTRDAGTLSDDGRLTVTGRLDDVLITGGANVAPSAVEAVLRDHPDVEDAVVFGRPDDEWGQRVVAAVVPTPGHLPDLALLRPWVAERLGAPAAPKELHLLVQLPLLHTGKADRRAVADAVRRGAR